MPNYTLSYNTDSTGRMEGQSIGGWPSFYSYFPDYMIGMNSYFYSFSSGNLWRHNTNETRNSYYGATYSSTITSVFNPKPSVSIKLFKTLSYESTTTVADTNEARWACTELTTDLTDGRPGSMLETYFEQKEGEWFSFIRTNVGTVNWSMRSANGIGICSAVTGAAAAVGPLSVTVNVTDTVPTVGKYIMSIKNSQAESHGARGYYLQFKLENDSTSPVEMYSVGSSVMKSYP